MPPIIQIILLSGGAGACILAGGLLARLEHIRPLWLENEFRHFVIALGGGVLLGAVAVVLVPQGTEKMQSSVWVFPVLLAGGLTFFAVELFLGLRRSETPQMMGMLLDYVPEAMALGGLLAAGSPQAWLLALLIGLQNLPEGFNTYRELRALDNGMSKTLLLMAALVPLGPLAGLIGYFFLSGQPFVLGAVMIFASGGMLYLIFQDLAPQSRLARHWAPPLGAVIGFSLALGGHMLVNGQS